MESRIQKLLLRSPAELSGIPQKAASIPLNNNNEIKLKGDSVTLTGLRGSSKNYSTLVPLGFSDSKPVTLNLLNLIKTGNSGNVPSVSRNYSGSSVLNLPARNPNAVTGSEFIKNTKNLSRMQREDAILSEVLSGNVPDFARKMKEVNVSAVGKDGKVHTGTIKVIPDYLAIGSNSDFIRIPMDPLTAQKIADRTGTVLPTRKIVNDVYKNAEVKLKPQPIPPSAQMMSNEYYQRHNNMVEQQRISVGAQPGQLIAGNKKDVVISNALDYNPGKVAIYGWHQPNGKAIQPLSTIHENTYADYSHGVRLVSGKMTVDGVERNVADVMRDPNLASLVSDEGVIKNPRIKGV